MASPEELETYAYQLRDFWRSGGPNSERISKADLEFANIVISRSAVQETPESLSALRRIFNRRKPRTEIDIEMRVNPSSSQLFPERWTQSTRAVRSFLRLWRRERFLHGHKSLGRQGNGAVSDDSDNTSEQSFYLDNWRGMRDDEALDDGWVEDEKLCAICGKRSFKRFFLQGFEFDGGYHFYTRNLAHVKGSASSCKFCWLTLIALGLESDQEVRPGDDNIDVRSDVPINSGSFKARHRGWISRMYNGPYKIKGKTSFYLSSHAQKTGASDRHGFASATHSIQVSLLDTVGPQGNVAPYHGVR